MYMCICVCVCAAEYAPVNVLQDLVVEVLELGIVGGVAAVQNGLPLVVQTVDA